jgi:hypothetical protein
MQASGDDDQAHVAVTVELAEDMLYEITQDAEDHIRLWS